MRQRLDALVGLAIVTGCALLLLIGAYWQPKKYDGTPLGLYIAPGDTAVIAYIDADTIHVDTLYGHRAHILHLWVDTLDATGPVNLSHVHIDTLSVDSLTAGLAHFDRADIDTLDADSLHATHLAGSVAYLDIAYVDYLGSTDQHVLRAFIDSLIAGHVGADTVDAAIIMGDTLYGDGSNLTGVAGAIGMRDSILAAYADTISTSVHDTADVLRAEMSSTFVVSGGADSTAKSGTEAGGNFDNVTYALTSNNQRADTGNSNAILIVRDFEYALDADAVVDSVQIHIEGTYNNGGMKVGLTIDGATLEGNWIDTVYCTGGGDQHEYSVGDETEFGFPLTVATVNDTNFGIICQYIGAAALSVDHASLVVYTVPCESHNLFAEPTVFADNVTIDVDGTPRPAGYNLSVVDGTAYGRYTAGDAGWTASSSRKLKNVGPRISQGLAEKVLAAVRVMPLYRWAFKGKVEQHVGPMAEDWYPVARLLRPDAEQGSINSGDQTAALLLIAQELDRRQAAADSEIADLRRRVNQLDFESGAYDK